MDNGSFSRPCFRLAKDMTSPLGTGQLLHPSHDKMILDFRMSISQDNDALTNNSNALRISVWF